MTEQAIKDCLATLVFPELGQDIVSSNWVKSIDVKSTSEGHQVHIRLVAGFPCDRSLSSYVGQITDHLQTSLGVNATIDLSWSVANHQHKAGVQGLTGVKNIIAVASGKGGVGKSTTSVNLALALASEGAQVGLLDADIYGPSQPIMLGQADQRPESKDKKTILPVTQYGIQSMSIGYLIEPEQAMAWRGPMASGALQQLINDTQWQDLDYLIVDLPPGTGDIQLTLAQKVPVTAAVIVTTPQDIALADAIKAITMFNKVSIPVLGVVENMSTHTCSNCGHSEAIFGSGGGEKLAAEHNAEFLGSLPLAKSIRDDTDAGKPSVVAEPDGEIANVYRSIAKNMTAKLSLVGKNFGASQPNFPTITITND